MGLVHNIICLLFTLHPISQASPIQAPPDPDNFVNKVQQSPDHNFCELPRVNGIGGSYRYLEDCENITNFENLPKPASDQDLGVHPYVCCPKYGAAVVCFPTDPWCPSFDAGTLEGLVYEGGEDEYDEDEYDDDYDYSQEDYGEYENNVDYFDPEKEPKVSENVCPNRFKGSHDASSTCVNYKDCEGVLTDNISEVDVCGWDESDKAMKVCCPKAAEQQREQHDVAPRYTETSGDPYSCEDKADYVNRGMCRKWKRNGGCDIDKHFELTKDSPEDTVTSHEMFHFMMMSCMKTCRRCSACQDEHPKCRTWAKDNMCSLNPWFMGHTCRESCGVCGFLSPFNKKTQKVGGKTYSDIRDDNFDCGRTKLHEEVTNGHIDDELFKDSLKDLKRKKRQVTGDSEDDVFFSTESQDNEYSCGAIIVADRWAVAAAHCYPNFGVPVVDEARKIKLKVIRDYQDSPYLEHLEVKRVYIHPKYKYPNLYNDIAVVELGRRIEYDFEEYGDTPACLNKDENIIGKLAEVQGYGFNEDGDRGKLQVAENLKIITHDECRDIFRHNITGRSGDKRKLKKALPNGLNDQLLCAQGLINVTTNVFPGSCKGDSGGPLFLYPDDRQTLVGIVSGGIGCGKGYPGWYTKASFFARWIICIMESSVSLNNDHDAIQEHCQRYTKDGSVDRSDWLD